MKILSLVIAITLLSTVMAFADGQIDISYAGYTISQPGSYVVVKDLHATTNQNAITVSTCDVTVDLNGHVLYGAGTAAGSSGIGVFGVNNQNNIAVYNGTVRDFREYGVCLYGDNQQVSRIRAYRNGNAGIFIGNGTIWNNSVQANLDGIQSGIGSTVTGNSAYQNTRYGIYGTGCTIIGNTLYNNSSSGIRVQASSNVIHNTARFNNGAGIESTGEDNSISQNLSTWNLYGVRSVSGTSYFEQNKLSGNTTDESLGTSTEGAGDLANVIF